MKSIRRLLSVSLIISAGMSASFASADALTDLLNSLGLPQLFSEVGSTVGTIGASVLDPIGTGDNDFLGVDLLNSEDDVGATLGGSGELTGTGNNTDSETLLPLDALGLSALLDALGLTYDAGFATQLRGLVGPEGLITEGLVGVLEGIPAGFELPGLAQSSGLVIDGAENGLLGLSLLDSGSGGNGGAIGVAILSGSNSGNGEYAGVSLLGGSGSGNGGALGVAALSGSNSGNSDAIAAGILGGDNTGNGGNLGVALLSGDNAGNGENAGVAILNGANSGNGDTAGIAVLSGDNSGNAVLAGVGALNGANSGNSDTIAVGVLNGENSGNGGVIGAGALNGPGSGQGGLISVVAVNEPATGTNGNGGDNNGSCTAAGSVGCAAPLQLAMLDVCADVDGDGVCDDRDECLDTPANMPVFLTGCHLTEDAPLVLRGVNFEFDKADLTPASLPILEHAVRVLAAQPESLVAVDGHTDSKGSDEYNMRLSYLRARAVYSYLIDAGIDDLRLAYRGYGESVPVAPNTNDDGGDDPVGRAENRRVELNILDVESFQSIKQENLSK
ncbi:OmpA family protein [Zhongshania sp.]|jgi:outer membrane protein OmpA-like peptidoglycan-associated protein|uniref:OmpA family protein n=1 Tax=Zhongshania sp. TaxID=1971902 RepID=UPI002A7F2A58|nr:OmpA family protein [Zhongshania sp.]